MAEVHPATVEGGSEAAHARVGPYDLTAAMGFGPRILGLRSVDSPQLFTSLGDEINIETPGLGTYTFRGGHRLWVSPEQEEISYAPDDRPCTVTTGDGILTISGPQDAAGFQKTIETRWHEGQLLVDHMLRWQGDGPVEVASWGITQLPLGGVAILPVLGRDPGTSAQANRSLILWPYSRLDDQRITWRERVVLIRGLSGPQLKLGSGPAPGRLGYWRDGFLFVKTLPEIPDRGRPDRGAVAQVYVNEHFCELESVGSITRLEPGEVVGHREVWRVDECADVTSAVGQLLDQGQP
jgi:hypothetical protein